MARGGKGAGLLAAFPAAYLSHGTLFDRIHPGRQIHEIGLFDAGHVLGSAPLEKDLPCVVR